MTVYFDYNIKPYYEVITHTEWHRSFAILAVASSKDSGSCVTFHLDEGEQIENSLIERNNSVSRLAWHPTHKCLATGWNDGALTLWNENDKTLHEAPSAFHTTTLTGLCWNAAGSRLVTADENGLVCIWKVDQKGRFQQSPIFKHQLKHAIITMVLKTTPSDNFKTDMAAAARAAIHGDASALDMFDTKAGHKFPHQDHMNVYLATKDGTVFMLNESGKCVECFRIEGAIVRLMYYEKRDIVVSITDTLLLVQHALRQNNAYEEISKVKLSGNSSNLSLAWAGPGMLATSTKSHVARILDLETDENFVLSLDGVAGFTKNENVICIAYSQSQGVVAGGTDQGHVAMWTMGEERQWRLQPPSEVSGIVQNLTWAKNAGVLAVNCTNSLTIFSKAVMNCHFNDKVAVAQVAPTQLVLQFFPSCSVQHLKTDVHIKGVSCNNSHTVIWNGKKVVVYEVSETKSLIRSAGTFNSDAHKVHVYDQNVYLVDSRSVSVRNFQGTVKQELTFTEREGMAHELDVFNTHMVVGSTKGTLKMFDLARREARQIGNTKTFDDVNNIGQIRSLKCNFNGTKVAVLAQNQEGAANPIVYVWDVETNAVQYFNTASGEGSLSNDLEQSQSPLAAAVRGSVPQSIHWDTNEAKLLAIQVSFPNQTNKELIVTMFSSPDHGLVIHDYIKTPPNFTDLYLKTYDSLLLAWDFNAIEGLLGLDTPYYYYTQSVQEKEESVGRTTLRDFVEIENADDKTKSAMLSFSFLSAVGNMDEAFKAIKTIKSGSVWESMARMCVKTKRLDVAMVCLGNMGDAGAARALQQAQREEPETDAHVAMLAVQIGMYDEAERLYTDAKRYDLLVRLYCAWNKWEQAIECAEKHDRIHLRTTYYAFAKYLEDIGDQQLAIKNFENSGTHRFQIPHMLIDEPEKLHLYITNKKDKELLKWWAQYSESLGDMTAALEFYEQAKDYFSMVRIHCFCSDTNRAEEICEETGDASACYHLARHYESSDELKKAIHYFSRAQSYSNAIRLAKENGLDQELMNLALLSSPQDMLESAKYFEEKGDENKAVVLYHRGGGVSKAIDLAFQTEQFSTLQLISEDLDENADPEVVMKCAEFFIEHEQYDKAVNLLVVSQKLEEAIRMCYEQHITITEELAEKMSPEKVNSDAKQRALILEKIGECAYKQGSYHLATKKFTQAGNKIKAMKALLKSGDTEKIVFFAGVSRQKEIYVMAANYLQSLDWQADPTILKNIISFYTKGKALESLATFYDSCAQVEIDEFENYEKALAALTESYKCLSKAKVKNPGAQEEKLALLKTRISLVKKYIQALREYKNSAEDGVGIVELLLDEQDIDQAVRLSHIYSFLIQHYVTVTQYKHAFRLMEEVKQRGLGLERCVPRDLVDTVYNELGVVRSEVSVNSAEDEEIEEEVQDYI